MLVSILHRVTGAGLSIVGLAVLTWWLTAVAAGPDAYASFAKVVTSPLGLVVLVGLTWAFLQHLLSGIRHLAMDTGAAFDLRINKLFAVMTIAGSLFLTALSWYFLMGVGK